MLRDIERLGKIFQKRFQSVQEWPEIILDDVDIEEINIAFEKLSIRKTNKCSIELLIDNKNSCIVPSQYIAYAILIKEFAIVLKNYIDGFEQLKSGNPKLADQIKSGNLDTSKLFNNLDKYSQNIFLQPFEKPEKRLNAKDIINKDGSSGNYKLRGTIDWFGSIILKVINVADSSTGILGKLVYELSNHPEQYSYFENKLLKLLPFVIKEASIGSFVEQTLRFLEQKKELSTFMEQLSSNQGDHGLWSIKNTNGKLTSIFKKSQMVLSLTDLIMGDKPRFFVEPFYYNKSYYYLSTEWTNKKNSRLDLQSFISIFTTIFPNYQIHEEKLGVHTLSSKGAFKSNIAKKPFNIAILNGSLNSSKLSIPKFLPERFTSALSTKPFLILTGLSGSGKTKLAEAFSLWISESPKQHCMIAVGADWTNREPLLGFPDALNPGKYIKPDNGALDLIINAANDLERPYFLILDEMNMSHVERYFADFLSAMESHSGKISLHPSTEEWEDCDVPATVTLPKNLFVIGTVNIDETTYMFSPKVLDRANVIEFRVSDNEMEDYFKTPTSIVMDNLKGQGASMGESFVAGANEKDLITPDLDKVLMPFFKQLKEAGAEFGYRTASEISRFIAICRKMADTNMTKDEVIDAAIMQKLLPKLHGSQNKLAPILKSLGVLCLKDKDKSVFEDGVDDIDIKYLLSYNKLKRMHKRVLADGFTSFAEA